MKTPAQGKQVEARCLRCGEEIVTRFKITVPHYCPTAVPRRNYEIKH